MTPEQFFTGLFPFVPFFLFKILTVILLLLHVAFSLVLVQQTKLMIAVVEAKISPVIYIVSIIHLLFSIFVLIWAILYL